MNQVEVKRRQIQSFSYVLACINIWVFGKSIGDNGLGYLAAAVLVFALFWVLTGHDPVDLKPGTFSSLYPVGIFRIFSE